MRTERQYTLAITVSGGTGSSTFIAEGHMKSSHTKQPVGPTATYDFDVVDYDGFGITGREDISGDMTMSEDKLCTGLHTVTIANATKDGVYLVRFYIESNL